MGEAEVRDMFRCSKFGVVAGCLVRKAPSARLRVRLLRDNVVIWEGEIESLKRFKEDVKEVREGLECGIGVKNYQGRQRQRPDQVLLAHRGSGPNALMALVVSLSARSAPPSVPGCGLSQPGKYRGQPVASSGRNPASLGRRPW